MRAVRSIGLAAAILAAAVLAAPPGAVATSTSQKPRHHTTTDLEARRVDRVPTPRPDWFDCSGIFEVDAECAAVELPLDYDKPKGRQTAVAVLRIKATDQERKIGTLFLNPGGPGGSGVEIAAAAPFFLGPEVLARFDIVGFDPRGVNFSDNVRCWRNAGQQSEALAGLNLFFPWTTKEESAFVRSAKAFGRACSTTGRPLSAAMSTAEVARDMDVLRRVVKDRKLTYLGFSYGSYLGNARQHVPGPSARGRHRRRARPDCLGRVAGEPHHTANHAAEVR